MANFSRVGFGQVEPNHLSMQKTAEMKAQAAAEASVEILENGQFVKYNAAKGTNFGQVKPAADFSPMSEWYMVFNEVKLYDDFWRESYKDFAMIRENYTPGNATITHDGVGPFPGQMVPRIIKLNIGDSYTTNCIGVGNTSGKKTVEYAKEIATEAILCPNKKTGYLVLSTDEDADTEYQLQVAKVYTMPDGQPGLKLVRVK